MNPIAAFRNMQHELQKTYNFPLPVTICIKALSGVHWVWWLCRKRQMVKPENIVPAALGTVLEGGLRFAPNMIDQAIRGVAKLILIATRIDESIQRMRSLGNAFANLKNAVRSKFSLVIDSQWIKNPESMVLSVQTINKWQVLGKKFVAYVRRIYYCVLDIFTKTFKLSMQLWDTYHAFVFSHDAVPEIFVNGMYWFRKIRNNKDYINAKLEEYRSVIQNIFEGMHISASADNLIDKTKNFLNVTVRGIETVENVNTFIGEKIIRPVKKIIHIIKSKLLSKDLESPRAHTPFVLKKHPDIVWAEDAIFKTCIT